MNVQWLWEQLQCLAFVSHRSVGKDAPLCEAWLSFHLGLGWGGASCALGKVTLLLFWGSRPARWCWSALWRRTWCTRRRTPPSTTGKSTTESSGSLFKAPPTLEPSTEEWGKPSRTSSKVPGHVAVSASTLGRLGKGLWVMELGRGMGLKSVRGLGRVLCRYLECSWVLTLCWASPTF